MATKVKKAADQAAKDKTKAEKKYYVLVDKKGKDVDTPGPFHNRTPRAAAMKAVNALCKDGKPVEVRLRERGAKLADGRTRIHAFSGVSVKPEGVAWKFGGRVAKVKKLGPEYLKAE
jgi:hypothetical protein